MLQKLTSNLFVVRPPAQPRFPYGNCLYIDGEEPLIVDAGAGKRAFSEIRMEGVSRLLLSHCHFDHIHSAGLFPHASILSSKQEENCYPQDNWLKSNGYCNWDEMLTVFHSSFSQNETLFPGDVFLRHFPVFNLAGTFVDGQVFDSGAIKLMTLHLPGHTAGHYGFFIEAEGVLFSGDIDLVKTGPWMGAPTSDIDQLEYSVQRIKEINPRMIVPSHRSRVQTDDLHRQLDAFLEVVIQRQERILDVLKIPHTIEQLAEYRMFYSNPQTYKQRYWERMIMQTHITYSLRHHLIKEVSPGIYQRI